MIIKIFIIILGEVKSEWKRSMNDKLKIEKEQWALSDSRMPKPWLPKVGKK